MSKPEHENIHTSSLTTVQLQQKVKLEMAADLIRGYKIPGNVANALDIIQSVIKDIKNV